MSGTPRQIGDYLNIGTQIKNLIAKSKQFDKLLHQVRELLPPPLDRHCLAVVREEQELILFTDGSAWASRLRFFSRDLAKGLATSGLATGRIRVRVMLERHSRRPAKRPQTKLSAANADLISQTADNLEDQKLKQALKRLARHRAG